MNFSKVILTDESWVVDGEGQSLSFIQFRRACC